VLLEFIVPPTNLLGLVVADDMHGRVKDNIGVLLAMQRAYLLARNHSEIFGRQSGVIAARANAFQILVSNLPADSIQSGGGSADRVTRSKFHPLNWSISHEPSAAKQAPR
jgi:hypothetical protein